MKILKRSLLLAGFLAASLMLFQTTAVAGQGEVTMPSLDEGVQNIPQLSTEDTFNKDYDRYMVAKAEGGGEATATAGEGEQKMSEECKALRRDSDADIGHMIRIECEPTIGQMSALMDNPLGNVAMLFTQFDLYRMENPTNGDEANKGNYMGLAQFPKGLGKNWNIINRIIWNIPSMPLDDDKIDDFHRGIGDSQGHTIASYDATVPSPIDAFDGRTTGFGDMYYNGLFSPKEPAKKFENGGTLLWGLGFDLGFPTATEDILGTGKWLAGPSGLGVYMGPKWKVGALAQQFWDYAGDDDRADVNLMNLQYFIFYSLNETTSIGAAPNIIANWDQDSDNRWTVPIGLGFTKTVQMGKVPVRLGLEVHYSVITPDDVVGSKWDFRLYAIPAVPSALFSWMQ